VSTTRFDLTGKTALVTAASAKGGLGHAIALGLAEAGADVAVSDIDEDGAMITRREIEALGRRGAAIACDNGRREDIQALFIALDRSFGQIDILINNAGAGARKRPEDLTFEEWSHVIAVSLTGAFLCCAEAGRRMIARGTGGSIINISSIAGSSALGRGVGAAWHPCQRHSTGTDPHAGVDERVSDDRLGLPGVGTASAERYPLGTAR